MKLSRDTNAEPKEAVPVPEADGISDASEAESNWRPTAGTSLPDSPLPDGVLKPVLAQGPSVGEFESTISKMPNNEDSLNYQSRELLSPEKKLEPSQEDYILAESTGEQNPPPADPISRNEGIRKRQTTESTTKDRQDKQNGESQGSSDLINSIWQTLALWFWALFEKFSE